MSKSLGSRLLIGVCVAAAVFSISYACASRQGAGNLVTGDVAQRVYVAPGTYDEFYAFLSGGFNGQMSVYALPSGRRLKTIPVFSQYPENGYGYNEETKAMLNTSYGFIPW